MKIGLLLIAVVILIGALGYAWTSINAGRILAQTYVGLSPIRAPGPVTKLSRDCPSAPRVRLLRARRRTCGPLTRPGSSSEGER